MKVSQYTAETSLEEREYLKHQIANGELQGIIAIRCLDEGVDIPSVETAVILASSTNPRQFIQRRGRVLRVAPGKKSASIYDMIVIPPSDGDILDADRTLVRKELARFIEFADLAKNSASARATLLEVQKRYSLMDM
jgi:superfamily II DNA or RNA helicase